MQLTQKNLDDFKKIYKSKFDIDISDKQALEYGLSLLNLMKILILPNKHNKGE